jgi:CheY-like chemotaxis protein
MAERATGVLSGRRILVVEDDYLIATDLARSLEDLGAAVLGPAGSVKDALALLAGVTIDAAVLDINLGTEKVFPLADTLLSRRVPFVFTTGYDRWIIPSTYAGVPRLEKPIDTRALVRLLAAT